jgi:hypothetical protein
MLRWRKERRREKRNELQSAHAQEPINFMREKSEF